MRILNENGLLQLEGSPSTRIVNEQAWAQARYDMNPKKPALQCAPAGFCQEPKFELARV